MDTRAAASAKRSAESPSCVIDEVDPKKNKYSAATVMDAVSKAADWGIFAPPEDPMWPDETKKLSPCLNEKHYDRIMDRFMEEERILAKKKFEGVSKQAGPGVDAANYLAHQMPNLSEGIAQILLERELTTTEHRHILEHGLRWTLGTTASPSLLAACLLQPITLPKRTFWSVGFSCAAWRTQIQAKCGMFARALCTRLWKPLPGPVVLGLSDLFTPTLLPRPKAVSGIARSRTTFSPASQGFPKVPPLPWSSAPSLCRLPLRCSRQLPVLLRPLPLWLPFRLP